MGRYSNVLIGELENKNINNNFNITKCITISNP